MTCFSSRFTRSASILLLLTASLLVIATPLFAGGRSDKNGKGQRSSREDNGKGYDNDRNNRSDSLYGFGKPVAESADTPSSTEPGYRAVDVAGGLRVRLITDRAGQNADMIALWPDSANPTHSIICNEINGTAANAPASVQRVDLHTGEVKDMVSGMISCDPVHRTAWGTIIVGEESGPSGRVWEILDPLNVSGVKVDRVAGTTTDEKHVVARTALGQVSYEGIVILPNGTAYYGDELRPSNGKPGGGIYKFIPKTPWSGNGPIDDLDKSPLKEGQVYVMRLTSNGADYGQGTNTGEGQWVGPLSTATGLAASALAAGGYTGYYRPEDMDLDPIAWANGEVRLCWANTGNDGASQWGEVLCLEDDPDSGATAGSVPLVTPFVIGNPSLRMPDNVAFQPGTGILYVLMDATTSAEDPTFTNDDVWACLPDGDDDDVLSDGCVRVMTNKDGNSEFTGIEFLADGKSFLIHLQHRTQDGRAIPNTADELLVSGLHNSK